QVAAGGLSGWPVGVEGFDVVCVAVAGVVVAPGEGARPVAQGDLFGLAVGGPVSGCGDLLVEVDDGTDGDLAGGAAPLADLVGGEVVAACVLEVGRAVGVEVGVEHDLACRGGGRLGEVVGLVGGEAGVVVQDQLAASEVA